ncbi:MAG: tetratricopeptide repeat protein, partial [Ktedonobacterales bacterium]|nr:tetratricopeptide repeat protein [Ktedonobacterales bacterium]
PLGITVLVTSRHRPSLPNLRLTPLDVLTPGPAAAVFAARYAEAGGAWEATRDGEPAAQVVERLGLLPLAIELAAADAAINGLSVAALAAQLADAHRLNQLSDATDPTRGVRYAFERGHERLPQPLRDAFAALGLPEGADWPRAVIEGLLSGALAGQPEAPTPAAALTQLAARSLILLASEPTTEAQGTEDQGTPEPRVRLHPLLREYAEERWSALAEERQSAALTALLVATTAFTTEHESDFAALAREEELLAGAIRRAGATGIAPRQLAAAVGAFWSYLYRGGHWRLGQELLSLQLAARRAVGDRAGEGATLNNLGTLARGQGRAEEAARYYTEALAIRRAVGDRAGEGATLHNIASIEEARGQRAEAARHYQEALALYTALGLERDMQDEREALARLAQADSVPSAGGQPAKAPPASDAAPEPVAAGEKRRRWWPFGR